MQRGVFSDVRVLDLTNYLSGPTLTRLMVEMGAEVIKVELPPIGDPARVLPQVRDGRSGYHVQQNRGKKSLFVDAKSAGGRELLRELVTRVDVFVENLSPGAAGRLGFGWEEVSALNPRLVMCSISAFGQDGPLAGRPGYDGIAQGYAAVLAMNGEADGAPALMGLSPGDVMTGVHGLAGVAAALYHRERTGRGQHVDVSLVDSYFHCHEVNVQAWSVSGGVVQPHRNGSHHPILPPYGVFPTNDGHVVIGTPADWQFAALCRAIGQPDLATDAYPTVASRIEHRDEVVDVVTAWTSVRTRDDVVARLEAERVPVGPVLSVAEAATHPHLRERRTVRTVRDPVLGEVVIPGFPIRMSGFPGERDLVADHLGGHNHEVVCDVLGWDEGRYRDLVATGVLCEDPTS